MNCSIVTRTNGYVGSWYGYVGPLLTSVDAVPPMKIAGVVENSRHYIYSVGLKCF